MHKLNNEEAKHNENNLLEIKTVYDVKLGTFRPIHLDAVLVRVKSVWSVTQ